MWSAFYSTVLDPEICELFLPVLRVPQLLVRFAHPAATVVAPTKQPSPLLLPCFLAFFIVGYKMESLDEISRTHQTSVTNDHPTCASALERERKTWGYHYLDAFGWVVQVACTKLGQDSWNRKEKFWVHQMCPEPCANPKQNLLTTT